MVAKRIKPACRSLGATTMVMRAGEIHLHDAVPDTEFFFIAQLSCEMKTAGLPICSSKRNPPGKKTDKAPERLRELAGTSVPMFSA